MWACKSLRNLRPNKLTLMTVGVLPTHYVAQAWWSFITGDNTQKRRYKRSQRWDGTLFGNAKGIRVARLPWTTLSDKHVTKERTFKLQKKHSFDCVNSNSYEIRGVVRPWNPKLQEESPVMHWLQVCKLVKLRYNCWTISLCHCTFGFRLRGCHAWSTHGWNRWYSPDVTTRKRTLYAIRQVNA